MRIYLAATCSHKSIILQHRFKIPYLLESYYYVRPWQMSYIRQPFCKDFILDSGAFTILKQTKKLTERCLQDLIEGYVEFIRFHNVRHYLEMDIDDIIGYPAVLKIRRQLERETGIPCIPCWHNTRTKEDYIQTCKDYDYVAHGSASVEQLSSDDFQMLNWFADEAHRHGAELHCMGFTQLRWLPFMRFDSVDSKSWKVGGMTGNTCFYFVDGKMTYMKNKGMENRTTWQERDVQNLTAWIEFANHMARNDNAGL